MKYLGRITATALLLMMISCGKSFLETPISTDITRQSYISDLNTCQEYLNGLYIELADNVYYGVPMLYSDIVADNLKPATGQTTFLAPYQWNQVATSASSPDENMNSFWIPCCKAIRAANYLITKASELRSLDAHRADDMIGQAQAIRALIHHQLVIVFAQPYGFSNSGEHQGIPYIKSFDWTEPISTQTVAQNYEEIISDLNAALQKVSPSVTSKGYISQTAVKAILARVYLFKNDYAASKKLAVEISKSVPLLPTENYPDKLFTQQESEAIFQLTPSFAAQGYSTLFPSYYLRKIIAFVATDDITHILNEDPNDKRKKWIETKNNVNYVVKFPTGVVSGSFSDPSLSYFYSVIRSSEMHLTAAECYAKVGNEDSARFYLDAIRRRANSVASPTIANGNALLDSIAKERRKEYCFENFRMFDLLRTGKSVIRIDADVDPASKSLPYPSPRAISPMHSLDITYYGLPQNPTY